MERVILCQLYGTVSIINKGGDQKDMNINPEFVESAIYHLVKIKDYSKGLGYSFIDEKFLDGQFTVFDLINEGNRKKHVKDIESFTKDPVFGNFLLSYLELKRHFDAIESHVIALIQVIDNEKKVSDMKNLVGSRPFNTPSVM